VWDLSVDLPLGFTPEVRRSSLLILLEDAVRIGGGEFVDCKLEVALRFNANDFLLVFEELPPDSQFGFTPDVHGKKIPAILAQNYFQLNFSCHNSRNFSELSEPDNIMLFKNDK
jgi:hypothetical protein